LKKGEAYSAIYMMYNAAGLMTRHSKLSAFYQAFQRVSQYLGDLITTGTFLRYTSARYGYRVAALTPALPKLVYREPSSADIALECPGSACDLPQLLC